MGESISSIELRLKKIDEKKQKFYRYGSVLGWKGDFPYPSSDGQIKTIDQNSIKKIVEMARLVQRKDLDFDYIKSINRSIYPPFDGELRGEESLAICKGSNKEPIRIPTRKMIDNYGLIDDLIRCLKADKHIIIIAAVVHIKLTILHPFKDGNGRTAHCLMQLILAQGGYPIIPFEDAKKYLEALECTNNFESSHDRFCLSYHDEQIVPFLLIVCEMIEKQLDDFILYHENPLSTRQ